VSTPEGRDSTVSAVLEELRARGTEQNRKVYRRHGVGGDLFGVSYADLKALKKRLKVNYPLAIQLWASGNHDARILATMIADPAALSADVDVWLGDLDSHVLTDAFAGLVARSPLAVGLLPGWLAAAEEWTARAGWRVLSHLAEDASLPDDFFLPHLERIQADIHASPNRVKEAMNGALIAVGGYRPGLTERALAVAAAVGQVEVDHGDTNCKTPDAAEYIRKTLARKKK